IVGAGLTVNPTDLTANSTTVNIGLVAATTPVAGTTLPANGQVTLVISLGTTVPILTGRLVGDANTGGTAVNQIVEAGLVLATITFQTRTTVPAGIVIAQDPAAAAQVNPGTAVNLVVSSGPPPVTVPNVVGLAQAAASTAITNAGLVVGTVTFQASTTV